MRKSRTNHVEDGQWSCDCQHSKQNAVSVTSKTNRTPRNSFRFRDIPRMRSTVYASEKPRETDLRILNGMSRDLH